jgi:hypothetical protein
MKQYSPKIKTKKIKNIKSNKKFLINNEYLEFCPIPEYIEPVDE